MFDYSIYIFTWCWAFSKHDFPVRKSVQRSCRGAPMRCWSPSAVAARTRFDPVEAPFVFADFVWWRLTPPQRNDGSFRLLWRIHNIIYIYIHIYIYTYVLICMSNFQPRRLWVSHFLFGFPSFQVHFFWCRHPVIPHIPSRGEKLGLDPDCSDKPRTHVVCEPCPI